MFEELIAAAEFHEKKLKEGWTPMEAGCHNNIVEVLNDMEETLGALSRIEEAEEEFRNLAEDLSILRSPLVLPVPLFARAIDEEWSVRPSLEPPANHG